MLPPFWLPTSDGLRHRIRRSSSLFLNSGLLLILLLAIALFFIFILLPPFLSFTSQIFRPHLVKKSWDSLNLVLVLFAIACAFLNRNQNSNEDPSISNASQEANKSNPSTPHPWYEYSDRTANNSTTKYRLRSSSSYPDLRQESACVAEDERWRFCDDTHISNYHFPGSDQLHRRHPRREPQEEYSETKTKTIAVDTFVVSREEVSSDSPPPTHTPPSPPPQPTPPPTPTPTPPPPSKSVKRTAKRTSYEALGHHEKTENEKPRREESEEQKSYGERNEKKRSPGSSATKDFLISLTRKKKKRRQKSVENFDSILSSQPSSSLPLYPPPSPPPPPPPLPPPPSSVFHNLFSSKKTKTKKVHSVPAPPPASPPASPPPRARTARKPPLPAKTSIFDENVRSGNESPLVPIPPPPPPPPPFKMPEWKFVVQGDFVRIKSDTSSRSGSPDLDETETDGGDPTATPPPMFCPSPDVDTKADTFIARFRANLKLEKMNSIKQKRAGPVTDTVYGAAPS